MEKEDLKKGQEEAKVPSIPTKQGETGIPKKEGEVTATAKPTPETPKAKEEPKAETPVVETPAVEEVKAEEEAEKPKESKRRVALKNIPGGKVKVNTENARKLVDAKVSTEKQKKYKMCYCCGNYFEVTERNFTIRGDGMIYNHCHDCQRKLVKDKTAMGSGAYNDKDHPDYNKRGKGHYYKWENKSRKLNGDKGYTTEPELNSRHQIATVEKPPRGYKE